MLALLLELSENYWNAVSADPFQLFYCCFRFSFDITLGKIGVNDNHPSEVTATRLVIGNSVIDYTVFLK